MESRTVDGAVTGTPPSSGAPVLHLVPFGRPALRALSSEVARAQHHDPLAPVTVVVPKMTVGLAVRRLLASGDLGPDENGRVGVVNVRFVTLTRLADELGSAALARTGLAPAPAAVVRAAVRASLAESPGELFGPVRSHPATARALAAAVRDLRGLDEGALAAIASQSRRAHEVVRLVRATAGRLAGFYDERELLVAAAEVVSGDGATLATLGRLVVHLPMRLAPEGERLVAALVRRCPAALVVGLTGDAPTDLDAADLGRRLAGGEPTARWVGPPPSGTEAVSAPSADAEVLGALRSVMDRAAAGVALERMAVVHSGNAPYPRLIRDTLEQAGIPYNGLAVRPLSAAVAGRTLLGVFALPERDWRRDDVMAWISSAPVRHRGRPVPASAWDDVSKEAGIVAGLETWGERLVALADARRAELAEPRAAAEELSDGRMAGMVRRIDEAEGLAAFVAEVAARLDAEPRSWAGWARWAGQLLADLLGPASGRVAWPTDESQAATAVDEALDRLAVLDRVEPGPDLATFRTALAAELEAAAPQTSRFGRGVLVARAGEVAGLDLDAVFVLGMDDAAYPAPPAEDPLLPDVERAAGGPDVPLRAAGATESRREYLAALAAAPARVLSFARWDQGRGRAQRPSRWFLETVERLGPPGPDGRADGGLLTSADLNGLERPGFTSLASYTATVAGSGQPVSLGDRDLQRLTRWVGGGRLLADHYLARADPVLARGLDAARQRRSDRFTRFDGRITGHRVPSPAAGAAQSPTGLQSYATCPRSYLFAKLLRISVRDRPEAVLRIKPTDKGTLVHRILERYVAEQLAERRLPLVDLVHETGRIERIAAEEFALAEQAGLVGHRVLWSLDRAAIRRDLVRFVAHDAAYRAASAMVPAEVEMGFGPGVGAPVAIELSDGSRVDFKGIADRVDRGPDGSLNVLDYKTGSPRPYERIRDDPLDRGRRLQLPVYGLAAQARFGAGPVQSAYWFVSSRADFKTIPVVLDAEQLRSFTEVVGVIVRGVESGNFPARPGAATEMGHENCRFCDFDAACPADRGRGWARVSADPALAEYRALAEGPAPSPDAAP
ncbi:MAG TPA: PD-(D/E)XK nuclease family protein [Acidimicrobiales bacterium]|nr:PD-(D/E)XK nuclease family protein [Acidimicrobiales bacterium]